MRRLHDLCDPARAKPPEPSRRGFTQQPQRRREQALRRRIVTLSLGLDGLGYPLTARAQRLWLSARTLRQWEYDCRRPRPQPVLLGRPVQRAGVAERNAVIEVLNTFGPALGLPSAAASPTCAAPNCRTCCGATAVSGGGVTTRPCASCTGKSQALSGPWTSP